MKHFFVLQQDVYMRQPGRAVRGPEFKSIVLNSTIWWHFLANWVTSVLVLPCYICMFLVNLFYPWKVAYWLLFFINNWDCIWNCNWMECTKQGTSKWTQDFSFLVTHPVTLHLKIRTRLLQSPSWSRDFFFSLHHVLESLHNLFKGRKLVLLALGLLTNSFPVLLWKEDKREWFEEVPLVQVQL